MLNKEYIVHILQDKDALYLASAGYWLQQARQAIQARGVFHVALTGGSTPQALYRLLAGPDYAAQLDWPNIHVYIGDERYVPHGHPDSNFGMAKACLLDHVAIPAANLHPIPTDDDNAGQSAARYADELRKLLPDGDKQFPQFDLIMLGMGDDGHTASLFPDTEILHERDKSVAAVYVDKLASWRISLTYPSLNQARQIMLMVSGDGKADILAQVLTAGSERLYPVQQVHNAGEMHWFIDQAAASRLA